MPVLSILLSIVGWIVLAAALAGSGYMLAAAVMLHRFLTRAPAVVPGAALPSGVDGGVTLLKPLYGDEPRLARNLASFLDQDDAGPIQLLCGVHTADDPAVRAVEALRNGAREVDLTVDARVHGANGKVTNLINMAPAIRHPLVVLSDSDIAVTPDYLARLRMALAEPGVGVATCLYRGRGDAGFWSRFAAMGLSYQFLPGAAFGAGTGLAAPCMGSTIALTRQTLDRIGGFAPLADVLADDYAIGEAVRALGLKVVVPPMLVVHACAERSLRDVWRHELRWAATVRVIAPGAYAASIIALPLPLALIGALLTPGVWAVAIVVMALLARLAVRRTVDRIAGARTGPAWLLPLRDLFALAVFVASFAVRSVDWRDSVLRMADDGRITAARNQAR